MELLAEDLKQFNFDEFKRRLGGNCRSTNNGEQLQNEKDAEKLRLDSLIKGGYRAEVRRERKKRDNLSPANVL